MPVYVGLAYGMIMMALLAVLLLPLQSCVRIYIITHTGTRQACDGPHIVTHEVEDKPKYEKPYLILDVRTPDEYQQCHIVQGNYNRHAFIAFVLLSLILCRYVSVVCPLCMIAARNFPHQHLNQDKISADLLRYVSRSTAGIHRPFVHLG